jgi:hypothetical protein
MYEQLPAEDALMGMSTGRACRDDRNVGPVVLRTTPTHGLNPCATPKVSWIYQK